MNYYYIVMTSSDNNCLVFVIFLQVIFYGEIINTLNCSLLCTCLVFSSAASIISVIFLSHSLCLKINSQIGELHFFFLNNQKSHGISVVENKIQKCP